MKKMKKILLAYSNSSSVTLGNIEQEYKEVQKLFAKSGTDKYYVWPIYNATIDDVLFCIDKFSADLCCFMYSGHADQTTLKTEKKGIEISRLDILRGCPNLQLVVLNGCATSGSVKFLQDIGIPIVISTKSNVDDGTAKEFAVIFWEKILDGKSVKDAFDDTRNILKVKTKFHETQNNLEIKTNGENRDVGFDHPDENTEENEWEITIVMNKRFPKGGVLGSVQPKPFIRGVV